jgi:hypothetical protein
MGNEKLLYKIDGHRVMYRENYGIVAPGCWTTNGHYGYVARLTQNWLEHGSNITESTLPLDTDFANSVKLCEALKKAAEQ